MVRNELCFRQIHLDFHTSPLIEDVCGRFNAEQYARTLAKARVNSVTTFARCHHGMLYYDSKINPERIHPHLANKNLLKEQIDACRKEGIKVPIYTSVQWDQYTAEEHPEWLCRDEEGRVASSFGGMQLPYKAGFYGTLCLNSPYCDFLKAHCKELLELFAPVEGLFFDIVFPVECTCGYCKRKMTDMGLEPHLAVDRQIFAQKTVDRFVVDMSGFVRSISPNCRIFYNKGHVGVAHRPVVDAYSHFELETLPSGSWGYLHFPASVRYARRLGLDCLAQTGKFHTMWGDFHSFKNRAALEFECFQMLAQNAKCLIGDQMEPGGQLSEEVYKLIGSVYEQVEKKEPWCSGAVSVTEIGVLTPEEFTGASMGNLPKPLRGTVRMLQEGGHQFDILDSLSDFTAYRLLILPDCIPVGDGLAAKLNRYLSEGGTLIASCESGLNRDKTAFSMKELGVSMLPDQPLDLLGKPVCGRVFAQSDYADYLLPEGEIGAGLPHTEHAMYIRGIEVKAAAGAKVLAPAIAPVFDRDYRHFCSHRQSPSSGRYAYDGIVKNGNCIYFAHPIFTQYNQNAPLWCKKLLLNAIRMLIGQPLLTHNGPSAMIAAVNDQKQHNRRIVHLLYYVPERRCEEIDIIEDTVPLYNILLSLKVDKEVEGVYCVPQNIKLAFTAAGHTVSFSVPEVIGHQMVEIRYK